MLFAWIYQLVLYVASLGMVDFAYRHFPDAFCVLMLLIRHALHVIKKVRKSEKTEE